MTTYFKMILLACAVLPLPIITAAHSQETVNPAEPAVIVLPSSVVSGILVYLNSRPYQESARLIESVQHCLQDQLPDSRGITMVRGNCPDIAPVLQRLKTPPEHSHPLSHPEPAPPSPSPSPH